MATNEENSPKADESPAPTAARKKSKTLVFIGLALLVAAGGAGWYFLGHKTVAAKNDAPAPLTMLHLKKFVVNLADTDRDAYLRVGIDISVAEPKEPKSDGASEQSNSLPRIRDAILGVLSTYHSSDLLTSAGKKQLKDSLLSTLNRKVPRLDVRQIYFTDFLVQR